MKTKMLFSITLLALGMSATVEAKVSDFNALISENISAQKELHQEVRGQMGETRTVLADKNHESTITFVGAKGNDINVPTNKRFMRFKKEIVDHTMPDRLSNKRLANELKSTEMAF